MDSDCNLLALSLTLALSFQISGLALVSRLCVPSMNAAQGNLAIATTSPAFSVVIFVSNGTRPCAMARLSEADSGNIKFEYDFAKTTYRILAVTAYVGPMAGGKKVSSKTINAIA